MVDIRTTSPFGGRPRLNDDNFFNAQANYVDTVVANKVAWGIPNSAVNPLVARRAEYEPLYYKCQDKNTRTRTDVVAHRRCRKVYENELRTFHNERIGPSTSIPVEEKLKLGGREKDIEPTPRGKIAVIPYVNLKAIGGGDVEVRCRTEKDQTRCSKLRLADGIECRYILVPKGEMPPEGQKDARKSVVSRKARFTISLGDEQAGERFYGFFRWVNLTTSANSGPWSPALTVVIA
jgi:hypothetical protein